MHVLIVALHRPTKPTGVCRHAANLARCLVELPEVTQVTLLTGLWQRQYFETAFNLTSSKIKIIGVDIQNRSSTRNAWFLLGLPKVANQLCPNIVHLAFPLPFLRSRFNCPVVSTIHDLYPYEFPQNFGRIQSFFNRLFLRQCVTQSDGLSCVSQVTLDRLNLYFPDINKKNIRTVVYNYVDFSETIPKIPDLFRDNSNVPFLLCVAQHRKNKNLDLLLDAYALLLEEKQLNPATLLVLVGGSGPETKTLNQKIQALELQQKVLLIASISDGELYWLYDRCELYVAPSSTEGFCLPLVEALYSSCQVVCSDIPIFREVAGPNCHYFELNQNSLQNLSMSIATAISNASREEEHQAIKKFSKPAIAQQYMSFYYSTQ
jgi:glycosyltransferase involved in cell wall biosynthesis